MFHVVTGRGRRRVLQLLPLFLLACFLVSCHSPRQIRPCLFFFAPGRGPLFDLPPSALLSAAARSPRTYPNSSNPGAHEQVV
eukprot:768513-Hanusia_phi.AAC.4